MKKELHCLVKLRYLFNENESLYLEKDCHLHQKIDFLRGVESCMGDVPREHVRFAGGK
jgi:hypothetical protein